MSQNSAWRMLAAGGATVIATMLSASAGAPAALAHHQTARELCGSPYTKDKQVQPIRQNVNGRLLGRLVLVKHRRSDTYCAVTIRRNHKRKRFTLVELRKTKTDGLCSVPPGPTGCWTKRDPKKGSSKKYRKYAGPLYGTLGNGCLMADGLIGGAKIRVGRHVGDCF